ncbi:MAG: hypothetical protein VYC38_12205 [Pseudomonadota bacterium]|jgi:hypothetical protein|nr:hypothetical protein [Pseudomonadota bacterium]
MSIVQGPVMSPAQQLTANTAKSSSAGQDAADINQRFEQLLWAEMLAHTGLEEAFTKSGGQAASAFSRMIIESIAEDLARSHPLGLDATGLNDRTAQVSMEGGDDE